MGEQPVRTAERALAGGAALNPGKGDVHPAVEARPAGAPELNDFDAMAPGRAPRSTLRPRASLRGWSSVLHPPRGGASAKLRPDASLD